jgi:hypothetical protein
MQDEPERRATKGAGPLTIYLDDHGNIVVENLGQQYFDVLRARLDSAKRVPNAAPPSPLAR